MASRFRRPTVTSFVSHVVPNFHPSFLPIGAVISLQNCKCFGSVRHKSEQQQPKTIRSTGGGGEQSTNMIADHHRGGGIEHDHGFREDQSVQMAEIAAAPPPPLDPFSKLSAHSIGEDSWMQMAFILVTSVCSAFILGYPKLIMSYLGWTAGMLGLLIGGALSLYANCLIASLHYTDGKRRIRYRDLAGHIYGNKMYMLTWILQYSNLFTINTGFIILAGQALKGFYVTLNGFHETIKLPYWIAIVGCVCFCFAFFIPYLSALRTWIGVSTAFTIVYVLIVLVACIKEGRSSPPRDYNLQGTSVTKTFNIIAAVANIAFSYNTGILPELQATLRDPAIKNMKKALYLQFTVGSGIVYLIVAIGYWAYGSKVSAYLLNDIHASKPELAVANLAVFLQSVISLHIFASPMYEFWDTKFARPNEGPWSFYNTVVRFAARGSYLSINTLVAACLPFLGDFTNLTGALSTFPLSFVLSHHMYLTVKWKALSKAQKWWHWSNVVFFATLSLLSCVSAVRLILVDSTSYHLFADL